jgi:hypothetical protein
LVEGLGLGKGDTGIDLMHGGADAIEH